MYSERGLFYYLLIIFDFGGWGDEHFVGLWCICVSGVLFLMHVENVCCGNTYSYLYCFVYLFKSAATTAIIILC